MILDISLGHDLVQLLLRLVLGTFFFLARFRWIYDPQRASILSHVHTTREPIPLYLSDESHPGRHTVRAWFPTFRLSHLQWKICHCGYGRHPAISAFVALVEIFGGLALIVGLLTQLAALGLLGVLCFATYCTAREKVLRQNPIDRIDVAACYLWTVEPVYIVLAVCLILGGPGLFSLDALVWSLL